MSAAKNATTAETKLDYRVKDGLWASAWKIAAGAAVLGILGTAAAYSMDAKRAAFSYLFAFQFFLSIGIGALMFVLVQHLTSAAWSVTVRRTAEFFMAGLPAFILLFLPLAADVATGKGNLFTWVHAEHSTAGEHEDARHEGGTIGTGGPGETGSGHVTEAGRHATAHTVTPTEAGRAGEAGLEHGPARGLYSQEQIEEAEETHLLAKKKWYLNTSFFFIRALIYFAIWTWIAMRLFGWSTRQDVSKDPENTVRAQSFAPAATFLAALTLTFAAFDWIMSLDPFWYSTIFGVYIFAGGFVAIHAILILVTLSFRKRGLIGEAVNTEHYHDLGKLLFGFNVFWAYISFAQFFLIWYASIPEETRFYHFRWGDGPWKPVSLAILVLHFVLPFVILLSRNTKRRTAILSVGTALLLVMHMVEVFWQVLPNYNSDAVSVSWMDLTALLAVGGVYLALVFRHMSRHALIPVGDPRLERSLHFENA